MKRLSIVSAAFGVLLGLTLSAHATVYLDDTWADGTRTDQNLPTESRWFYVGGTLTATTGTMTMTIPGSSAAIITYFTPTSTSTPVELNVGDTLTATFRMSFQFVPAVGSTSQGYRLGIFNNYTSSNSPPRITGDGSPFSSGGQGVFVEGYALFQKFYGTFADDQPIDIKKRMDLPQASLLGSTSAYTTIGKPPLTNANFTGFMDFTNYTFQTVLERTGLRSMAVTMTWSNQSNGATLSASTTDNVATNFSFDTIELRTANNTQAPGSNYFHELKIEVTSVPVAASIVSNPPNHDVASGQNVTFTCEANGTLPLAYQWYYGTNTDYNSNTLVGSGTISFVTNGHTVTPLPSLTITNAQVADAGSYSVIVSNAYGSVTSSVATLLVADIPPGVASQPQDLTVIPGQFATFSVIATGSVPLSYQWYYNTSSLLTNATAASLTLTNVQPVNAGIYSVIVSNPLGTATSSNAVLNVDTNPSAPVFIIQPISVTVRMFDPASFTAAAVGDAPITYQWYTNSLPISGATSPNLNFPSVQPTEPGTYVLIASNAIGTTSSSNAVLTAISRTPPLPVIPTNEFNILNYGGHGDGVSNNAAAIQSTVDAASASAANGGIVIIPTNGVLNTYMSGPIVLSNNINLFVSGGAKLIMLPRVATPTVTNWPSATQPLIDISGRHDVAITGSGTIDGNAGFGSTNWWQSPTLDESDRPKIINVHNVSSNILIKGITLQNSPVFHVLMKGGNVGVTIDGVTWNTPGNAPNTDAMDIASTNVLIQNCTINVGDDNVQMGGSDQPAADITISNCYFGTGHGVSIGSPTQRGVHELLVSNCTFNGTDNGIRMKTDRDVGGLIENLKYMDISMNAVRYPIIIYSYYNSVGTPNNITPTTAANNSPQPVVPTTPIWRDIIIRNLIATNLSGSNIGGIIWGRPELVVSNVTLDNVVIVAPTRAFNIYNARAIRILNSDLTAPSTSTNSLNLYNAEVILTNSAPNTNLFTLGGLTRPGTNNTMSFFNARAAFTETNLLTGPITLGNSTLTINPGSASSTNTPITIVDASTLAVTSGNNTLNGALTGSGALTLNVPASTLLTLRGNSAGYSGALVISNSGTVLVNNTAGSGTGSGAVTVLSTAKLGGTGTIGGPVTVDGTLAAGASPGTLTIANNLTINGGAALQYELGTSSDLVAVSSNLTLGGTLNVTDSGGFGAATYNLFTYGGILTDNGLTVGTTPNPSFSYAVNIGTSGLVKLDVTSTLSPFEQWQVDFFGSTTNPAGFAGVDADGDGLNNTNEFQAGTNPTNSLSALRILSAVRQASNVAITWSTAGGRTNVVQASAGTVNGSYTNNFVDIAGSTTVISGSGDATTNFVDVAGATNAPSRFYRIRLAP